MLAPPRDMVGFVAVELVLSDGLVRVGEVMEADGRAEILARGATDDRAEVDVGREEVVEEDRVDRLSLAAEVLLAG